MATEYLAARALATTSQQKELLRCVGRHSLLAAGELALVLGLPGTTTRSVIERSLRQGLLTVATPPANKVHKPVRRYVLTQVGLEFLAARDGVPWRRYARHGHFDAELRAEENKRLWIQMQQWEHTTGANSFFVRCTTRPGVEPHLVTWLSAFEAATRFDYDGGFRILRPDGFGEVEYQGADHAFFLEWDRDTERNGALDRKIDCYEAYYQTGRYGRRPVLLIVTPSPKRENVFWREIFKVSHWGGAVYRRALTTSAPLVEAQGPFGAIWRSATGPGRHEWLAHDPRVHREPRA